MMDPKICVEGLERRKSIGCTIRDEKEKLDDRSPAKSRWRQWILQLCCSDDDPERFWWDGGADEVQKIRKMDQLTSSQQDAEMTDGCEANGEIAFGVFESCIYCSVCDCSTLHEALKEMASAKKAKER